MTDSRRTRLDAELVRRGISFAGAVDSYQLKQAMQAISASGCELSIPAITAGSADTIVLAAIASQTNTLTIVANPVGHSLATGIVTLSVADAAGDTLAVTNTAGVITITLANTTDSKNTLTLIKAALDLVSGGQYSTFITGTASTQVAHGGTNTVIATAAGGTAAGAIKSSTAGALATRTPTISP